MNSYACIFAEENKYYVNPTVDECFVRDSSTSSSLTLSSLLFVMFLSKKRANKLSELLQLEFLSVFSARTNLFMRLII